MRQRVVRVAVAAVAVALLLFALPLAITIRSVFFSQERGELQRAALGAALRVGPQFGGGDKVELPAATRDTLVGVYDLNLRLRAGHGPPTADSATRSAARGVVVDRQIGSDLVVAVPVTSAEDIVGVVRASVAARVVWGRVLIAWLLLAALAGGCLLVAVLVARRQARLISEPLELLSVTSQRVTGGDLTARAALSSIPEIHRVAGAHNAMISRLTDMIEKEQDFSANASHQLRTSLTRLQLILETAQQNPSADLRSVLSEATVRVADLHHTVDEVLALARLAPNQWLVTAPRPLGPFLSEVENRWHGTLAAEGRRLQVNVEPEVASMNIPGSLASQILDVLIDNAQRHGRGAVTVIAREMSDAVALDVVDQGSIVMEPAAVFTRGRSGSGGQGIGLALARSLAEASGGRLVLAHRSPTTFTLFLHGGTVQAGTLTPEAAG